MRNAQGLSRTCGLGSFLFARRYWGSRFCFPFLEVLRCISSLRGPPHPMDSGADDPALPGPGFPIRKSPGQSLFGSYPKLIAAFHVLHRLPAPRHPPYTLSCLTTPDPKEPRRSFCARRESTTFRNSIFKERGRRLVGGPIDAAESPSGARPTIACLRYCPGGDDRTRTDNLLVANQALSR